MRCRNDYNSIELRLEQLRVRYSKAEDLLRLYRETRSRCHQQRDRLEIQMERLRFERVRLELQRMIDE